MHADQVLVLAFAVAFTGMVMKSPIARAFADRIAGRAADDEGRLLAEIDALRAELDQVHEQLAQVNERVDFGERMLAAQRETTMREVTP